MEDSKIKVLIVEDEWEYTDSIRDILEDKGFYVEDSVTGEEAIEQIGQKEFDIVLIDIKLPDMSGIEILKKINVLAPDTISIMMTAFASIESSIEALTLGAFAYLYKPVNMDELLIYLRNAYHRKRISEFNKKGSEILDKLTTAVIATNEKGNISYWNTGARALLGWDFNEVFGKNIRIIFTGSKEAARIFELAPEKIPDDTFFVETISKTKKRAKCCMKVCKMEKAYEAAGNIIWTLMGLDETQIFPGESREVTFSANIPSSSP